MPSAPASLRLWSARRRRRVEITPSARSFFREFTPAAARRERMAPASPVPTSGRGRPVPRVVRVKIGTRLILSLAIPIAILVALFGVVEERSARIRLDEELTHEGRAIARTVQLATQYALRDRQLEDVY